MAYQFTGNDLSRIRTTFDSLKSRIANQKEETKQVVATVTDALEVNAASFAVGLVNGRTGGVKVFGIQGEFLAGAALHTIAFFGADKDTAKHLHSFGNGFLAAALYQVGGRLGEKWRNDTGQGALPGSSSQGLPDGGGKMYSDAEIDAMFAGR